MEKQTGQKQMNLFWALLPIAVMIGVMMVTIIVLGEEPHVPLMIGTLTAGLVAFKFGFTWEQIEEMMYRGIKLALPAIIIIMLVGLTIGSWLGGGIIASMIYYGLQIINPAFFLVTITIICAIVATVTGTSWGTMGTIGVAGMGIGMSMGIPAAMVAGAVISGAYFGDKMSPLSDTTNLAAGLTGTNLIEHIKNMFYTTIPGLLIALVVYAFLGRRFATGTDSIRSAEIESIMSTLQQSFVISPWLLLIPAVVIILVVKRVPAPPAILVGIMLGFICQVFIQGDSVNAAMQALQSGYTIDSGDPMVDELFNGGGLTSMMYTVSMTIVAMTFGGILEFSGMLQVIMNSLIRLIRSTGSLVTTTIGSAFLTNLTCSEQYISVVVPARMFARTYEDHGLKSRNLSRALEDGGTLTSVFVPWNTCGVFIYTTLGISAAAYAPYAVLNYSVPLISIFLAYTGLTMAKMTKEELAQVKANRELEAAELAQLTK